MSSDFIKNLKELETAAATSKQEPEAVTVQVIAEQKVPAIYRVVLDTSKDPDPYGYHGIPLSTRLAYMGWQ